MTIDPNIKRLLANRYRLLELIGKGAMGRVYRAEDTLLGGVIAVKLLSQTLLNPKMCDRFKSEARTCAQLGQKNIHIVRVMDYGVNDDDIPFYVMEYLQGDDLSDIIDERPIPLPRFLSLARQICIGLDCAHQGILINGQVCPIIHRDIKPSNILVSQDISVGELVKILDFGISKSLQADGGQTHTYMGTLAYSSPEQMEGRNLDARSDIYSLGVMLFEMLTGKLPLQADTHTFGGWHRAHHSQPPKTFESISPSLKLPKALETVVMSCLAKSPNDRPQSIIEVLRALEPLEQRYSANRFVGHRIGEALAKSQDGFEVKPDLPLAVDQIFQLVTWPKDKPIAQIVFAQSLSTSNGVLPTLWVMLPQKEIQNLRMNGLYNIIYKNFLCTMSPHPMLLWVTAIYNCLQSQEQGPRWLRCYLDLKTPQGQEIVRLLCEKNQYQVLLFALESPEYCAHTINVPLPAPQCFSLQEWAITSISQVSVGHPNLSKDSLKREFEDLKPKIAEDMEKSCYKVAKLA